MKNSFCGAFVVLMAFLRVNVGAGFDGAGGATSSKSLSFSSLSIPPSTDRTESRLSFCSSSKAFDLEAQHAAKFASRFPFGDNTYLIYMCIAASGSFY